MKDIMGNALKTQLNTNIMICSVWIKDVRTTSGRCAVCGKERSKHKITSSS